jgi:hypothetical protein
MVDDLSWNRRHAHRAIRDAQLVDALSWNRRHAHRAIRDAQLASKNGKPS